MLLYTPKSNNFMAQRIKNVNCMYLYSKGKLSLLRWVLAIHQNVILMLKGSDQMIYCQDNPVMNVKSSLPDHYWLTWYKWQRANVTMNCLLLTLVLASSLSSSVDRPPDHRSNPRNFVS